MARDVSSEHLNPDDMDAAVNGGVFDGPAAGDGREHGTPVRVIPCVDGDQIMVAGVQHGIEHVDRRQQVVVRTRGEREQRPRCCVGLTLSSDPTCTPGAPHLGWQ